MDYRPSRIPIFDVFDGHQHGHVPVYDAGLHRFVDGGPSGGSSVYVSGLVAGDNGTHAAANLTALQAALDAAETSGGGRVVLPVGVYQFAGTASIGSRVTYAGTGWGSIHKLANGASTTVSPKAVLAAKNNTNYVGVENLYIDGNKANQVDANYASTGIDFYTRNGSEGSGPPVYDGGLWCSRVMVYNCRGEGFYLRGAATTVRVTDCYAYHNDGVGFWFKTDCEAANCVAGNNGGYGFFALNATSIRWTNLKAFGSCQRYSGPDFLVSYCGAVLMSDCQAEDSGEAGFWWTSCSHVNATNLAAYRCAGQNSTSNKSAFWVEDDGADNLCNHFTLTGSAKCDGGASAFNYALTSRNLGPQCDIRLKSEGYAVGQHNNLSGGATGLSDSIIALDNAWPTSLRRNRQTGASYTLTLQDAGGAVEMSNGSANTVTFPPNSDVAIPVESVGTIAQYGAGTTTLVAGAGVTLRSRGGLLASAGQYAVMSWQKIGTNEFWITGDAA